MKAKKMRAKLFPIDTIENAKRALVYVKLPENAPIREQVEAKIYARYPELDPKRKRK